MFSILLLLRVLVFKITCFHSYKKFLLFLVVNVEKGVSLDLKNGS
jgi:hypothetical protein